MSSSIIEDLNGIETIKSLTGERVSYERVDREFLTYLKRSFSYTKADQLQQAIKGLLKLALNVVDWGKFGDCQSNEFGADADL